MQENEINPTKKNETSTTDRYCDSPSAKMLVSEKLMDAPESKMLSENNPPSENISSKFSKNVVILCILNSLPLLCAILLLKAPQVIFRVIDGSWAQLLFIPVSFISFLVVMAAIGEFCDHDRRLFSIQIITSILTVTMAILGFCFAHTHTYELSNPKDFVILNHVPSLVFDKYYKFEVVNDIDFEGYKIKDTYNRWAKRIVIEGNGYTIKNIKYSAELKDDDGFLRLHHNSEVYNLNFKDCEFEITPKAYDEKTHEGKGVTFSIVNASKFRNVNIDATVYIKKAEENLRYNTYSTVKAITPSANVNETCKINIKVVREE